MSTAVWERHTIMASQVLRHKTNIGHASVFKNFWYSNQESCKVVGVTVLKLVWTLKRERVVTRTVNNKQ